MSITCKDIIDAAYARSQANDPESLATKAELIALTDRLLKRIYAKVNKVNRRYFLSTGSGVLSDHTTKAWARPAAATAILRVENSNGDRVYIVPFLDRDAEIAPAIYPFGRNFYTAGRSGDPVAATGTGGGELGDALTFYYARRHASLNSATEPSANAIEAAFPVHYLDMLIAYVAAYLAKKGGRSADEIAALQGEYTRMEAQLLAEVMPDTDEISQRWESE